MTNKQAVWVVSDPHINSKLGLFPPGQQDTDGNLFHRNSSQRWLWDTWTQHLDDVKKFVKGYKVTLILNGDILETDTKDRSWQIMDRNPATILEAGRAVFLPILEDFVDELIIVRGTEAHVGKNAWIEEELANDLGAIKEPVDKSSSWWHFRGMFSGVRFDIAHHANMGRMEHTFANAANKLAVETLISYSSWRWEESPPDIVIRSHQHRFADSGRTFPIRAIFTPAWQLKTAYLYRIGATNALPDIGSIAFLCENCQYQFEEWRYKPKRGPIWVSESQTPT